jgi:PAS domain S-box-containing protein
MNQPPTTPSSVANPPFLHAGGELGELIRLHDWTASGLGPPAHWPQSLKTITAMLLASPVPIVLLWGEKGIMIYNDAYSGFAGGRHPRLLGSEVRKGWPEVADFNDNVMRAGLAGRTLAYKDQELTLYRNGQPEQVWMDLDYSPVYDESGQPAGVIAIVVETTQRVLARRHIQHSEERLRALVNATADLTYRVSPDWCEMWQLDGQGLLQDNMEPRTAWLETYVAPQHLPQVRAAIEHCIANRCSFNMEHQVRRLDGGQGWVHSRAVPLLDERGEVLEWFGAATDISARKQAEDTLRSNESRLLFLDSLGKETSRTVDADAIMAITTRLLGEHLGVSGCAYADVDPDEDGFTIRGDWAAPGARSIVGHYSLASFGTLAVANLHAGLPFILEEATTQLACDESAIYRRLGLAATICIPLVKGGRLTALMAINDSVPRVWTSRELALLTEVTERSWAHIERARAENQRRESEERFRRDLEARVAERTEALRISQENSRRTEQALQQAQKMEALGNLTGGIAHDFNNLLMAVLGSLELLRRRMPNDPTLVRLLDNAKAGAERGASLIARMLAFARRQELRAEPVELGDLVAGMSELLQRSLGATIELETAFPLVQAWVSTDANQLEAALLNLAVNARDAMGGQGRIVIGARPEQVEQGDPQLAAGAYWCLCVTDNGDGMDEHTLKRAIEPFFTTKGVGKGTGLGLSMVLGLAEQCGGTLRLRSEPGEGTCAEVWLPATAMPDPAPASAPLAETPEPGSSRVLDILTVDDDELVLTNTVEMLTDLGHRVRPAHSAREALSLLEGQVFDLLITDHAMPHMTGAQLAERMREQHPSLPVILVSGYADVAPGQTLDVPRLAKPFSQARLVEAVNRALGRS